MVLKTLVPAAITAFIFASAGGTPAHAGCSKGFLANIACESGLISKEESRFIDGFHNDLGRPLDRAGARAADKVLLGVGTAWEAQDEFRRFQERRRAGLRGSDRNLPRRDRQHVELGTYCATHAGVFGPGPRHPVGSSCWTNTWHGPVYGRVVR